MYVYFNLTDFNNQTITEQNVLSDSNNRLLK